MAKETAKKTKRPTAEKRMIQNKKRQLRNKMFKSQVRTSLRSFETTLTGADAETLKNSLSEIYSLFDKGVKRGVFKLNKARREKSKLAAKVKQTA